jgi:hypothetical protein
VIKHVVLKQDAEKPVPVEVLAESIKAIAQGVRKLREGPLNDRCLILLIQHAAPKINYQAPSVVVVRSVLDGIDALETEYLRKKK